MENVACSRLGTMLHLDIKKGKEATKTSNFQKDTGGTTARMKRLAIANKWYGQLIPNDTFFDDSYFSSVKTAEEAMATGVDYCGLVKMSHKGFCLATLEKLTKDGPRGSYFVMNSNPIVTGEIALLAI